MLGRNSSSNYASEEEHLQGHIAEKQEDENSSPSGDERRMKLLILANTLPILLEASDQGPLSVPQLLSPVIHNIYSKVTNIEASKKLSALDEEDRCDGDHEAQEEPSISAQTIAEASEYLAEIQKNLNDKIKLITRLEKKLIKMKNLDDRMKEISKENVKLHRQLSKMTEENNSLQNQVNDLQISNVELTSNALKTQNNSEIPSPNQCCKDTCQSLRSILQDLTDEREKMKEDSIQRMVQSDYYRKDLSSNGIVYTSTPQRFVSNGSLTGQLRNLHHQNQASSSSENPCRQQEHHILLTRRSLALIVAIIAFLAYVWIYLSSFYQPKYPI